APMASGWKKSRGFRIARNTSLRSVDAEVRAATAEDISSLIAAYEWLFAPPGSRPPGWDERRAAVVSREAISSRVSVVLDADTAGEVLGFITAYFELHSVRFGHRVWVEDFAVDP